jgi:hypothetical protein
LKTKRHEARPAARPGQACAWDERAASAELTFVAGAACPAQHVRRRVFRAIADCCPSRTLHVYVARRRLQMPARPVSLGGFKARRSKKTARW